MLHAALDFRRGVRRQQRHADGHIPAQHVAGVSALPEQRIIPLRHRQHVARDQLVDHRAHIGLALGLHAAKGGELIQPALAQPRVRLTAEHARHRRLAVSPVHRDHGGNDLPGLTAHVALLLARHAARAVAAERPFDLLTEILEDFRAQTAAARGVKRHLPEALLGARGDDLPRLLVHLAHILRVVDQKGVQPHVPRLIQQAADRILAVAPRAPRLLIIALQILGHVIVHDEGNVGFVNAHAERIGRHDHRRAVGDEILLRFGAQLVGHPRVVAHRVHAAVVQHGGHFLHALARAAVDDAALPPVLRQKAAQLRVAILRPAHLKKEIRPVEPRQNVVWILQFQQPDDVRADGLRRRRGEGAQARPPGQLAQKRRDLQIAGAEILPPLADAVRLIDDDLRDFRALRKAEERIGQQPLRRDVDDFIRAAPRVLQRERILARGQGAVEIRRANAVLQQREHLIAHQRNERRDDERHALQHERGNLVADRLARAGGHDGHHVAPAQNGGHRVLLSGAKIVVAKNLFERRARRIHRCHLCSFFGVCSGSRLGLRPKTRQEPGVPASPAFEINYWTFHASLVLYYIAPL